MNFFERIKFFFRDKKNDVFIHPGKALIPVYLDPEIKDCVLGEEWKSWKRIHPEWPDEFCKGYSRGRKICNESWNDYLKRKKKSDASKRGWIARRRNLK